MQPGTSKNNRNKTNIISLSSIIDLALNTMAKQVAHDEKAMNQLKQVQ
jgi:hypothetical protein